MDTKRRSQAEKTALVKEQLASGQTIKEFCRTTRGLNDYTFFSWRQRHPEAVGEEQFVEVTARETRSPAGKPADGTRLRVVLGRAMVEITGEVDEDQLEAVLRAVGSMKSWPA